MFSEKSKDVLTKAEQCIELIALGKKVSEQVVIKLGGVKICEMSGPEIISLVQDCDTEVGPDCDSPTTSCDYLLYQFGDGSLLWYVRSPTKHYLQLRGIYRGAFRCTEYIDTGDWKPASD